MTSAEHPEHARGTEPDKVLLWLVDSPDAGQVIEKGTQHPALGGLIDAGTTAFVRDGHVPWADIPGELRVGAGVRVVRHSGPLDAAFRAEVEPVALHRTVFVLLAGPPRPMVVAAGPALPCMGPVEECDLATLRASIRFALGMSEDGRPTLFTEPDPAADRDEEDRLHERLRQLYGE